MSTELPYPFAPGEWMPPLARVFPHVNSLREDSVKASPYPKDEPQNLDPMGKYPKIITDFKDLVESDPGLKKIFIKMFEEIPRFEHDPAKYYNVKNFDEEVMIFTIILYKDVNEKIKNIINAWGEFLKSPASTKYLNAETDGWFTPDYIKKMQEYGQWDGPIDKLYTCNSTQPNWGFPSWDFFFIRQFRPERRHVDPQHLPGIFILNPCEAGPQLEEGKIYPNDVRKRIQARDRFWLKGQPYSLFDMLDYDGLSRSFVLGTVYQGWLSSACYHRRHAPISGRIRKIALIPGTYYSTVQSQNYPDPDPSCPNLS